MDVADVLRAPVVLRHGVACRSERAPLRRADAAGELQRVRHLGPGHVIEAAHRPARDHQRVAGVLPFDRHDGDHVARLHDRRRGRLMPQDARERVRRIIGPVERARQRRRGSLEQDGDKDRHTSPQQVLTLRSALL